MTLHSMEETVFTIREAAWQEWEENQSEQQAFLTQAAKKMEQTEGCLYYRYEKQAALRQLSRYEVWQNGQKPLRREEVLPEEWQRRLAALEERYVEKVTVQAHEVYLADIASGQETQKGQVAGEAVVSVPGSKSLTNRALLLAALSEGEVTLEGVLFSDDSRHFLSCLKTLGFALTVDEKKKRVVVKGEGGRIPRKEAVVDVGSAGTAARFITAMLALSDGVYTIQCSEQMEKRPMQPLFDVLDDMGATFSYLHKEGFLPVIVKGNRYRQSGADTDVQSGDLTVQPEAAVPQSEDTAMQSEDTATQSKSELRVDSRQHVRRISMDIRKSTQFLSALLMMLPVQEEDTVIEIEGDKKTGAYIQITMQMLRDFGVEVVFDGEQYHINGCRHMKREHYRIEPDMSAACYFFAAAAITGSRVTVRNISRASVQGDRRFLEVLERMGCTVTETQEGICVQGTADGVYNGVDVDMNNFSDQALTLAVVAAFAETDTVIRNIAHIRGQESDRMSAIVTELGRCGIHAEQTETDIVIHAGKVHDAVIRTYEDHRVAMAFTLLSLRVKGIVIDNPMCCRKTFENFYDTFEKYRRI